MQKCDFNKVGFHIFRTPFHKDTNGRLLLIFSLYSSPLNSDRRSGMSTCMPTTRKSRAIFFANLNIGNLQISSAVQFL